MGKSCTVCGGIHHAKGFCKLHYKMPSQLNPKPINKISRKLTVNKRLYAKVRETYLDGNIGCEAKLPGCNGTATEIHHKAGKIGDMLYNNAYFLAVCRACHNWIEENPVKAKSKGLSINRL